MKYDKIIVMSAAYVRILMETGIWPAEDKIDYSALMYYHRSLTL